MHIINGLPLPADTLENLVSRYPKGVVTIEDGLIGAANVGVRGFAGLVAGVASDLGIPAAHIGITDPTTAPSEGHLETWSHFGITTEALVAAVRGL